MLEKLSIQKVILLLALTGLIIFGASILNSFVNDDIEQIVQNSAIHSITNIPSYFIGSTFYNGGGITGIYYKPVLSTVFALIYLVNGPNPIFFHLFQLILHITNSILLFLLFAKLFKKDISFFLALIFLVHPINSEAGYYISALQEPLSFFFGISALLILSGIKDAKNIFLALCMLLLSILSKETGIVFFLLAIFVLIERKQKIFSIFSVILLFLAYLLFRIHAVGLFKVAANSPIAHVSIATRLLNIPSIIYFYIKTFIFPLDLSSSYQWVITKISITNFLIPLLIELSLLFLILYFGFYLFKHKKKELITYIFFCLWFFSALAFHLQIFPLDATVAERWFYFPIVGLLGMFGVAATVFYKYLNKKWILIFTLLIISGLSIRSFYRGFDWKNVYTLDSKDIKVSKDSYTIENGLSYELVNQGKYEEAKNHALRSISLYPYITNYTNLGTIYIKLGKYKEAKESFLKALNYGNYYLTYEGLADLTLVSGDKKENIKFLKSTLEKFPTDPKLWLYLAILEYEDSNTSYAKYSAQKAYDLQQSDINSYVLETVLGGKKLDIEIQN